MGVSGPSLVIESTDSMIILKLYTSTLTEVMLKKRILIYTYAAEG